MRNIKKSGAAKKLVTKEKVKKAIASEPESEEYEVEKVVDHKIQRGKSMYKIRWRGFNQDDDTWEPEESLNCLKLIQEFEKEKDASKKSKPAKNDMDSESDTDNTEYEVERIIDVHYKKNGTKEFLLRWKGFGAADDTWEPEHNLTCTDMIEKFMQKLNDHKNKDPKELRFNPKTVNRGNTAQGKRLSKRSATRISYVDAE